MVDYSFVFHGIAGVYHVYIVLYPYLYNLPMEHAKGFGGRLMDIEHNKRKEIIVTPLRRGKERQPDSPDP